MQRLDRRARSSRPDILRAAVGASSVSDMVVAAVLVAGMLGWVGTTDPWFQTGGVLYLVLLYALGAAAQAVAMTDPRDQWFMLLLACLGRMVLPVLVWLDATRMGLEWSATMTVVSLTGLWAIPELLLLRDALRAVRAEDGPLGNQDPMHIASYLDMAANQDGDTLQELSWQRPLMLVFLRQFGCPFCRETLTDLRNRRVAIEDSGLRIVLVHMGTDERAAEILEEYGLGSVDRVEDPECELYRAFGLGRANFWQLFGLRVWLRVIQSAFIERNGFGPLEGDGFRMPGVFVLHRGRLVTSYRHTLVSARPDYLTLARCAELGTC
jgi:peroxiredoxin